MSRKQIGGMVLAVLVAVAILLGAGLLVLRLPAAEKDPYTDLEETEIPYAVRQAVTFSVSTPPAVPENYPEIQMKIREVSRSDFQLDGFSNDYSIALEDNVLIIRRNDWEEQSTEPLEVSREQQYTRVLQDLNQWGILSSEETYSVIVNETDGILQQAEDGTETPVDTERAFAFFPCYEGREMFAPEDDGCGVLYDAQGLKYLKFWWYDVKEIPNPPTLQPLTDAVARRHISLQKGKEWEEGYTKVAYVYLMDLDGATHRAKAYYENDLVNLEFADAETGEYISLSQFDYDPSTGPAATWSTTTPTDPTEATSVS